MEEKFICKFCFEQRKNKRALAQHETRCERNPNKKVGHYVGPAWNKGLTSWSKGLTKATSERLKKKSEDVQKRYAAKELVGSWKGLKHTEEQKKKISEAMKGNRNANHRGDRQTYYKGIRMDSRWEAVTAYHFDKIKVKWVYNERGFKLSDGRYYYPDFFLYKKNGEFSHLIEVKGYFRESNRLKFELFKKEYPEIPVALWRQDKLRQLGLLDCSGYSINNGE